MQITTSVNNTGHLYFNMVHFSFLLINSTLFSSKVSIRESTQTSELVLLIYRALEKMCKSLEFATSLLIFFFLNIGIIKQKFPFEEKVEII